jgi:hypothetical protein
MDYSTFRHLEPGAKLCLIQKGEKKEPQVDQYFLFYSPVRHLEPDTKVLPSSEGKKAGASGRSIF